MSTLDTSAPANPQPEGKLHDVSWLVRIMALLLPAGMVWSACHAFVLQMCVNNPHAWWSMVGFGIPAALMMITERVASLVALKRMLFTVQLICLVGVGIVVGLLSWVHWG